MFDLKAVANAAITELDSLISEKNIQLQMDSTTRDTTIPIDSGKIQQVLINLLSNAIKFTPASKSITISFAATTLVVGHRKTDIETVEAIAVSVIDSGVGIPEDELESVFDKFVQSRNTSSGAGGTGLGLAICQQIIDGHGGTIHAESNPNGGATVTFCIPREPLVHERVLMPLAQ